MKRVFLPPEHFRGTAVSLPADAAHYLTRVLRLKPGDEFAAIAPDGGEFRVRLTSLTPPLGELLEHLPPRAATALELTIYQGLPRGKRFPLVIQKVTELGAARLVAVASTRSQVRVPEREAPRKLEHWRRIAAEAAEQCLRPTPPELMMAHSWSAALAHWNSLGCAGLLLDETLAGEPGHGLQAALEAAGHPPAMAVFIGPEGGLGPDELRSGRAAGLRPVGLGRRILRTETAAIVMCALMMYHYGELG